MGIERKERLAYTEEAKKIVSQMTQREKLRMMGGRTSLLKMALDFFGKGYNHKPYPAAGCKRLGVPDMLFCDGPRGVVSGNSTCFPVTMLRGASFEPELEKRVGEAIGREVRAQGGNYYGGVCVNVPYNPGWGRSQEVYGEDTLHMGRMGVALTRSVQSQNVMACVKHYAFNSMENSRFKVNVTCDKRTEREVYLPHFKKCVDAGAASVMGAYNLYEGDHCCESRYLLTDVLRGEWGFDGFTVSDFCFGVHNTGKSAAAGMEIEMCNTDKFSIKKLKKAMKAGEFTEKQLDEAALRMVRTLLAVKNARDEKPFTKDMVCSPQHVALAREVAGKGITLLKNEGPLLPFGEGVKTLTVVGDLADEANIGDHGSSQVKPPYVVTFVDALKKEYPQIRFTFVPSGEVAAKQKEIQAADRVVLFAGYRYNDEGEFVNPYGKPNEKSGGDRKDLGLRPADVEMIRKVSSWNKGTAVVLIGGNMIRVSEWIDEVPAVLMAFYPGMEGGYAIADILFGKVNPSGKLPYVTVVNDNDLPQVDWDAENQFYSYYHGFHRTDKEKTETQFPYGYGLSYTQFAFSDLCFTGADAEAATFKVTVTNIGKRAGGEVAQLYIGYPESAVERFVKTLADFQKVYLKPGERTTVELRVAKEDLAWYDEKSGGFVFEDVSYTAYIGNDADDAMQRSLAFSFAKN